ncbi:uncharacterized protein ACWYII_002675 isoform 2-T2 [Salvelinus alpinus]
MTDVLPGSHAGTPEPELRLVLLGTIGCGKTLTGDTLLGQSSSGSPSSSGSSPRLCQLRRGASEGRRLTVVEAPRWYWSGGHMEAGVRKETERALELAAQGPHAFLLLVPVGQFTEVERRVPAEMEEVFGEGVLKHTLVLFTCGDYLMGRGAGQYLEGEDPGLREVIDRCGGQYHVINNRRPQDREQVRELLEKVENMVQKNRGCYIRQNTLQREMEEQARGRERELKEKEKVDEQARGRERELKEKVEEQARGRERELKEKVEEQARGRERELKEKMEERERERERELKEKVDEQAKERERERKEKVDEQARGRERELKEKVEEQARERERELKGYKVKEEKETVLESRHVTNTEARRYCGSQKREVTSNSAIERRIEEEREEIKREEESEEMENWKEELEKIKRERDEIMKSRKEKEEMERKIEEEWEKRRKDELEKRRKRRGRERELKEKVEEQARERERELKEKVDEQARGRERELKEKVEEQARERERELKEKVEEQARGRERELKEKVEERARERERELKEKVEEQARGRERELKEKVEEQARERERELKEKVEEQARGRERELKEKVEVQARGRERELKEKVEEQARERERELESRHVTNTETRRYWGNRKREVTPNSAIERRREEEREEIKRRREEMERKRREEGEDMEEKVTVKPLVNCLQSTPTPTPQQQPTEPQNGGPALFTRIPSFHLTEEGAILSQLSELEAKPAQKVVNTFCHRINSIGEKTTSSSLPSSSSQSELRVVLLGRSGSGKSAAGNIILGRQEFVSRPDITTAVTQDCQKSRALVAGRRVAVVDTPDWFRSEHPPDVVRSQLSSCVALSAPGPHAFILCVPVDQPAQAELQALGALEKVFGPGAVRTHTLVLFTHTDRLKASGKVGVEGVEKYISSQRRDLLELVKRCGDRYHVMERGSGGEEEEEERRSVGELLEKVEQTVREGGGECFSCPLFQEAEDRVRQRQKEIVRERRGRGEEVKRQALHSYSMQPLRETEEEVDEEEIERTREEAEKSVSALELENLPSLSSSSAWSSSLLRSVWEKVGAGASKVASKVPKLTAGGALLGGVVGVFFGGPIGGAIGATAGSVVTEVGRRRFSKTKNSAEETDATGRVEGEILDKVLKTE